MSATLKIGRRYRLNRQLRRDILGAHDQPIPAGTYCDLVTIGPRVGEGTVLIPWHVDGVLSKTPIMVDTSHLDAVIGRPYVKGLDPERANFGGKVGPAGSAPAPSLASVPAPDPTNPAAVLDALRSLLGSTTAPAPVATVDRDAVREIASEVMDPVADAVDTLRADIAPMLDVVRRMHSDPTVRPRVTLAAAASGNPILDTLTRYYRAGSEAPANVVLAAPPSIGKTFAVRELGKTYDLFLEHGCTDDIDEVATLLGSPVPDGKGGFVIVDGVLTQAVRAASSGQTVLLLLDEVFRLGERAQEWLLSFLTGVKASTGRVYRLRTRRADASGTLEVIECPTANLHLVAATNLGARTPVEAFWSRWEVVRFGFDATTVAGVAQSIAASYGIADANRMGQVYAQAVSLSRKGVAEGALRYPLDLRALERACQLAGDATVSAVAKHLTARIGDLCAHWGVDSGETDPTSKLAVDAIVAVFAKEVR